ncbi:MULTISPECIES: hypothetical protein [Flammeovirga]|nr:MULTISPECIES: hypothetical protein [Flammeovirga]
MNSSSISHPIKGRFKKGTSLGDLIRKGVSQDEIRRKLGLQRKN